MKSMKVRHISAIKPISYLNKIQQMNLQKAERIQQLKNAKKPMVSILIPTYGHMPSEFVIQLMSLVTENMGNFLIDLNIHQDIPVDLGRNKLVEMALKKNPDYMLFIDSDMLLPHTAIQRLVDSMEKNKADLMCGLYFMKKKPYTPVIRKYRSGGFWVIDNPPVGKMLEIDGTGMGCCLIRTDVFRKLEYPWFKFSYEKWGEKNITLSEDLYFCRKMRNAEMKMYCDTGLIAGHIGGEVNLFEYTSFAPIRQEIEEDREELLKDIQEYTNQTEEEVDLKVMVGQKRMIEEWEEKNPQTWGEKKQFYKETENYLYDLALWHFTDRRQFDVELVARINVDKPKNILDFGCGIGQNSIMVGRKGFDVTMADLKSKSLDFAEYRMKKHKVPYKKWEVDIEEKAPDEKYDAIFIFDMLEHIPIEEISKTVDKLIKLKHKDTKVYMTYTPSELLPTPMHYGSNPEIRKLIEKLLKEY